jgi:allantoin racemase
VRLLIVNPNTTASMTTAIGVAARAVAAPDTQVHAVNPQQGPPSIESDVDEHRCVPHLLAEIVGAAMQPEPPDAYLIACFGDPGLAAAQAEVTVPVLGIAQAAMHAATLAAGSFSVVTSMSATVPTAWSLAQTYTPGRCHGVHASNLSVLQIDADDRTVEPIGDLCEQALLRDQSRAIVLGCAAMARFAVPLGERLGVPVIDGVVAGVLLAEALVRLRPPVR